MSTDAPAAEPSGMTVGRSLGLALCAGTAAAGGWVAGSGVALAHRDPLYALGTAAGLGLWLAALWTALYVTIGDAPEAELFLPVGALLPAGAAAGLVGCSFAAPHPHPGLLGAAAGAALLAVPPALLGLRRRRREVARWRQRRDRGVSVPGVVTGVGGDLPRLTLTVRYTAADGEQYTRQVDREFPAGDRPRPGRPVTVRHLPDEPRDITVTLLPWPDGPH
ncbi:hypothetical protein GCM10010441_12560 [Kitasatospora paracochleata]|uniref:DUF3592 domain-containing protein n=1 Tax=Kitasatospora paracochleata TaxID=58354 RepID=A0ABT1IUB6_9ACTN|nr:DUF3592 domain-containing protein [Kitasatospora paracochleata]MCP2308533.1 hypothetical protein [Kitasatospora paracochleata]